MTDDAELQNKVEQVERVLDADSPPLEPLTTTTDYRQLLLAWARRRGLSLDEALDRLAADPDPVGRAWVDKINAHPDSKAAMAASLADPVFAADSSQDDSTKSAEALSAD
jgi:hypothetical protein